MTKTSKPTVKATQKTSASTKINATATPPAATGLLARLRHGRPLRLLSLGLIAGFVVGALTVAVTSGSANAASKSEIEAVVRDYIAAHGDELMASIQNAVTRQQMQQVNTVLDSSTAPSRGPKDAPVTIVEFSDFECPFCGRVQGSLSELSAKYGDNVRWVYMNLPLSFHQEARPAAYAALAADKQGKFWEYSQKLWDNQARLGDATYVAIAESLKLDMAKFNKDRASKEVAAIVDADLKSAESVGARGTPHFIINGESLSGALPTEEFVRVIDAKLEQAKK